MKSEGVFHYQKIAFLILLIVITAVSGCNLFIYKHKMPMHEIHLEPADKKINLNVGLLMDDEFRTAQWKVDRAGETHIFPLGDNLVHHTENLLKSVFSSVVILDDNVNPYEYSEIEYIMKPKASLDNQASGGSMFADAKTSIWVEWNLSHKSGKAIWNETTAGTASGKSGLYVSAQKKRFNLALQDLVNQTQLAMQYSYEIHQYVLIPTIMDAAPEERLKIAKELLRSRNNSAMRSEIGIAILHLAIDTNDRKLVLEMIGTGIDPNTYTKYRYGYPIHTAALGDKADLMKILLKNGADINVKDKFGRTALFYCSMLNNIEMMEYMISRGAEVHDVASTANESYYTAMIYKTAGDYYGRKSDNKKAISAYNGASEFFEKASVKFSELSTEINNVIKAENTAVANNLLIHELLYSTAVIGSARRAGTFQPQVDGIGSKQHKRVMAAAAVKPVGYRNMYRQNLLDNLNYDARYYIPHGSAIKENIDGLSLEGIRDMYNKAAEDNNQSGILMKDIVKCYSNEKDKRKLISCVDSTSNKNL